MLLVRSLKPGITRLLLLCGISLLVSLGAVYLAELLTGLVPCMGLSVTVILWIFLMVNTVMLCGARSREKANAHRMPVNTNKYLV
jgi:hypothetical protein